MTADLNAYLEAAQELARGAGAILMDLLGRAHDIRLKSERNLVTEADTAAEALIIGGIEARYPDHAILSEERGQIAGDPSCKWIIDPLDGTTNFAHNLPHFAVSIGLERAGEVVVGVIYDPALDEMYTATAEQEARLNGRPIRVSAIDRLEDGLLATGFPTNVHRMPINLENFAAFMRRAQAVRRPGAASLDLAYVATGRFDGFWEPRLAPWDMAAGELLVRQAGGRLSSFSGGPFSIYVPEIVATNGLVHDAMVEALAQAHSQGGSLLETEEKGRR